MLLRSWTIDPFHTQSEANTHEHWTKSSKRHKTQKILIKKHLSAISLYKNENIVIYIWRISSRKLDKEDNLPMSMKWVKDAIADLIYPGQQAGRADDTNMIEWKYGQEKGKVKQKAIRVEVYDNPT